MKNRLNAVIISLIITSCTTTVSRKPAISSSDKTAPGTKSNEKSCIYGNNIYNEQGSFHIDRTEIKPKLFVDYTVQNEFKEYFKIQKERAREKTEYILEGFDDDDMDQLDQVTHIEKQLKLYGKVKHPYRRQGQRIHLKIKVPTI